LNFLIGKKVACGAFFSTAALLSPAKGVAFAGCVFEETLFALPSNPRFTE
jgi:hypothetical protein